MITVTIDGVNRTSSIVFNSLKKTDNLNQQVDNLEFEITKYGSTTYVPSIGEEVIVDKDGETIFGGVIMKITEKIEAPSLLTYHVKCNDYSQYLKRQVVTERYTEMTVQEIIDDLITNYTTDGFTTNNVVGTDEIKSISFNRLNVADCLQKLANAIAFVWYVDYDMDIHFFPRNSEEAPFDISDTSGNYVFKSLEIVEDLTQLRNSIIVQGGEAVSENTRTELFSGDSVKTTFALANKFDSVPDIVVGTTAQTVGIEYIDDDASFDVMWNFNEKYIRFTSGNIPATGTNNISVEGTYLFPIVVQVPSAASINQFGTYEFAITDKSIKSQDEATDRAIAELDAYKNQLYEGSFRTYEDGLRSGQIININSTIRGKDIDVLIQSVSAKMRDPEGQTLEYSVKFATLKSIGIIEFLQNQIRSKEVIIDDLETLLTLQNFVDTNVSTTDSINTTTSTGPYNWNNSEEWGYGVWG